MENMKNDIGYESSDGDDSNASIKTVESVNRKGDNLESHVPPLTPSLRQFSRRSTAANSLLSTAQVRLQELFHVIQKFYMGYIGHDRHFVLCFRVLSVTLP